TPSKRGECAPWIRPVRAIVSSARLRPAWRQETRWYPLCTTPTSQRRSACRSPEQRHRCRTEPTSKQSAKDRDRDSAPRELSPGDRAILARSKSVQTEFSQPSATSRNVARRCERAAPQSVETTCVEHVACGRDDGVGQHARLVLEDLPSRSVVMARFDRRASVHEAAEELVAAKRERSGEDRPRHAQVDERPGRLTLCADEYADVRAFDPTLAGPDRLQRRQACREPVVFEQRLRPVRLPRIAEEDLAVE